MNENQTKIEQAWNDFVSNNKIKVYSYELNEDKLTAKTAKYSFTSSGELENELEKYNLLLVSEGYPEDRKYPITVKLKS